jgi:hypothetical protein
MNDTTKTSENTANRYHFSVLNQLFNIKYNWESRVNYSLKEIEREAIRLEVHQEYEAKNNNDFPDWSSPVDLSRAKMDSESSTLNNAQLQVKYWQAVIEYTADKFGLELFKTPEGKDAWRPKTIAVPAPNSSAKE